LKHYPVLLVVGTALVLAGLVQGAELHQWL
jgi:hypothetical protein